MFGCTTTKEYEQICISITSKQVTNKNILTSIKNHNSANKNMVIFIFYIIKSSLNKQDIQIIKNQSKISIK